MMIYKRESNKEKGKRERGFLRFEGEEKKIEDAKKKKIEQRIEKKKNTKRETKN